MNKWKINAIALAVPVLLLVGCATPAHVEKDEAADFTQYKTFAWVNSEPKDKDNKETPKENKGRKNDLIDKHVQQSVNKELAKQGWKEDKSRPDVLISYDILVEKNTRETSNPIYSRPYSRIFYNPYLRRYGTIYYPSTF
ncbi:DUF4136 domain-containing protein [Paraflavitalea speifideaquila]|uniref:DUF4136 domain-containing protein n=1 Tax=Paraflavitalea speifideaquila TaxID=3076558 RepID=UPI0028E284A2|nr:DUF4136 domain-containing protein [Paraflavitalea speifideiaquila]